jgi:glycosyltransferase involved in cell wall biosynthesis
MNPYFSIITASYNSESTIRKTIESILTQSYQEFEYIIIDGLSTDDTVAIVKEYNSEKIQIISEKDNGIYDAWNKGIRLAKGDWISFIGSDDFFEPNALQDYAESIQKLSKEVNYISSKVKIFDNYGKSRVVGAKWSNPISNKYMNVAHVGSMHSKKLFTEFGLFDSTYKITGDYEFLLRSRNGLLPAFIEIVTANMLMGGASVSPKAILEAEKAKILTNSRSVFFSKIDSLKAFLIFYYRKLINKL